MMTIFQRCSWAVLVLAASLVCEAQPKFSLFEAGRDLPHLYGRKENAHYLYGTTGDRLYCIGDQAGGFPAVGFHIPGEMGGIWQQPIKLLDGFRFSITDTKSGFTDQTEKADSFVTYSFTTQFQYNLPRQHITIYRTQFVPDTLPVLVVEYAIANHDTIDKELTIRLAADVNLMPVWLGERTGMIDSTDALLSFDEKTNTVFFKDNGNSWYAGVSVEGAKAELTGTQKSAAKGKGITGELSIVLRAAKGATGFLRAYISGSMRTPEEIASHIALTKQMLPRLFSEKKERYRRLEQNASLDIPDKPLQDAYRWGKYTSDWLRRDIPGLGLAMSAGLPDYPWFFSNDQAAAFDALLGTIEPDLFYSSWHMLKRISNAANRDSGRIIHEVSGNGAVFDNGRMEESQLHIIAAWDIFRWTGNLEFLKENYTQGRKIWDWLQRHDTNHNGYIEGYGGVEIAGLNAEMLDVQVATVLFLDAMSRMAVIANDNSAASEYRRKAEELRGMINRDWWLPGEHRFADFISSKEKALSIIDTALANSIHPGRNTWAQKKLTALKASILNGTYSGNAYAVYYNANMGLIADGVADSAKAVDALQYVGFYTNKFGAYIAGIDRPDHPSVDEQPKRQKKEFSYRGAVMPVATADLPIAAARYGQPDNALAYMHMLLNSFSYATPGTLYEISPDDGMFVQAWNIRGFNIPLLHYFFGIDPLAYKKEITLRPEFPAEWDHASITDVIVGDNRLSIDYHKESAASVRYGVKMTKAGWSVSFGVGPARRVRVNGKDVHPKNGYVHLSGRENAITLIR
jgi:hypothetical protein